MTPLPVHVLEQLLALARRLTSRRDLDSVLEDLLDGSLKLIPGSDFACVFLYNVEENVLFPVGGVGFEMAHMQHVRLKPGESMTGQAFVQKRPLLLPAPQAVREAQSNLSPENDRWVRLAVHRPTNPVRSSMAVPLIVGDRTVGVLVIDNYDTDRDFNMVDLRIASAMADHAAIAVANAQDYHLANALSHELQQTLNVQHQLVGSIMSPASSFSEILRTLADVIHRPVAVLDVDREVVAEHQSGALVGKLVPIRTGQTLLGYLAIGGERLSRTELNAVEQAAPLIALEFMKREAVEREQNRVRADLIYRILDNDRSALQDADRAFHLSTEPWMALAIGGASDSDFRLLGKALLFDRVFAAHIECARLLVVGFSQRTPVMKWAVSHPDAVLIWGEERQGIEHLGDELRSVLALWKLVSRGSLPVSEAAHYLHLRDFPEVSWLETVPEHLRRRFVRQVMGPVLDDAQSVDTLKAWLLSNRSHREAAEVLHTHPNTVRYRIGRMSEQLQRDLDDDHVIVMLWLALLWLEPKAASEL